MENKVNKKISVIDISKIKVGDEVWASSLNNDWHPWRDKGFEVIRKHNDGLVLNTQGYYASEESYYDSHSNSFGKVKKVKKLWKFPNPLSTLHKFITKLRYKFDKFWSENFNKEYKRNVAELKSWCVKSDISDDEWLDGHEVEINHGLDMSIFRENDMEDKFQEWLKDEDAHKGNDPL